MPHTVDRLVPIGVIARPHGVRGWLRVRLYDPASSTLSLAREVWVGEPPVRRELRAAEPDPAGYRVLLDGTDDRDAAAALAGAVVQVRRVDLPAPGPDEIYVTDLIGCLVVDLAGAEIGRVREAQNFGAHETLVVDGPQGEILLPFVDAIVREVDLDGRRLVCDPPEGLLELNRGGR